MSHVIALMVCIINLCLLTYQDISAQPLTDTTYTWQGYAKMGVTKVQIYHNPSDKNRTKTIILKELAENGGPSIVADLPYLAEEISRALNFNPTEVFWVLHWGSFSFAEARVAKKEIFLRASFKYTRGLQLSSPQWRVIGREEVEELTDRLFH